MRPPVAAENGNSPLRGKNANRVFEFASGMRDGSGFKATNDQVVANFTDDGKLADTHWNPRHHVSPSQFNGSNHTFSKIYFDKDFRQTETQKVRELTQQKTMDPYDENEVKGTRIPDYAKMAKCRDVYGELGWIGNHHKKDAKNNAHRHPTYREYFDKPKNYHCTFTNSTLTNSEFFRQNAPQNSVARLRNENSSVGFESWKPGTRMNSMSGSTYATPFVLDHDKSNSYKVNDKI